MQRLCDWIRGRSISVSYIYFACSTFAKQTWTKYIQFWDKICLRLFWTLFLSYLYFINSHAGDACIMRMTMAGDSSASVRHWSDVAADWTDHRLQHGQHIGGGVQLTDRSAILGGSTHDDDWIGRDRWVESYCRPTDRWIWRGHVHNTVYGGACVRLRSANHKVHSSIPSMAISNVELSHASWGQAAIA